MQIFLLLMETLKEIVTLVYIHLCLIIKNSYFLSFTKSNKRTDFFTYEKLNSTHSEPSYFFSILFQ